MPHAAEAVKLEASRIGLEAACADPARPEPVVVQPCDLHAPRLGGVDEAPVAQVDAVVAELVEEDEVARHEAAPVNRSAEAELLRGVVGNGDADLAEGVHD